MVKQDSGAFVEYGLYASRGDDGLTGVVSTDAGTLAGDPTPA